MIGTMQSIAADGGDMPAYVVTPPQGSGPALVLLHEIFGIDDFMRDQADRLAEEGYVCVVPSLFWRRTDATALEADTGLAQRDALVPDEIRADVAAALAFARSLPDHAGGSAAIGWCMGGFAALLAAIDGDVDCAVAYYPTMLERHDAWRQPPQCPLVVHVGDSDDKIDAGTREELAAMAASATTSVHLYPECGHAFANHTRDSYDKPAAMMAYSRTIALLRERIGPIFDLSTLWDKHTEYEFAARDVDATMATMVEQPYVNHIPTMTGGVGHDHLKRFYKYHFVNSNPPDTRLIPVSRTVGADRLVDEMIFCFTHTCEIPWMLPGLEPTGRYVEIPLVAIVNFRGDKLYHEHIYWDQASVLVQIGVLEADGLPVAGIDTAKKLVDETLPSNTLMASWKTSEGQPL